MLQRVATLHSPLPLVFADISGVLDRLLALTVRLPVESERANNLPHCFYI